MNNSVDWRTRPNGIVDHAVGILLKEGLDPVITKLRENKAIAQTFATLLKLPLALIIEEIDNTIEKHALYQKIRGDQIAEVITWQGLYQSCVVALVKSWFVCSEERTVLRQTSLISIVYDIVTNKEDFAKQQGISKILALHIFFHLIDVFFESDLFEEIVKITSDSKTLYAGKSGKKLVIIKG